MQRHFLNFISNTTELPKRNMKQNTYLIIIRSKIISEIEFTAKTHFLKYLFGRCSGELKNCVYIPKNKFSALELLQHLGYFSNYKSNCN